MSSFVELLYIYRWALPACILVAAVLGLIGGLWTARGKSAQIFVLGQSTSLGVVLGFALNIVLGTDFHSLSLFFGLCLGALTLVLCDRFIRNKTDRNHIYLTLFVLFLSLTYLFTALTPSLESHMAASYFGDIAVMSDVAAQGCLLIGVFFIFFVFKFWNQLTLISFQQINQSWIHHSLINRIFDGGTLLITTLAIQSMGYLFTVGSLFIATSFAAQKSTDLKAYKNKVIVITTVGSAAGFAVSLFSTVLPTVPCVVIGQVLVGLLYMKK